MIAYPSPAYIVSTPRVDACPVFAALARSCAFDDQAGRADADPHRADDCAQPVLRFERSLCEAPAVVGRRFSGDFVEGGRE
jgi:hypothetical protein